MTQTEQSYQNISCFFQRELPKMSVPAFKGGESWVDHDRLMAAAAADEKRRQEHREAVAASGKPAQVVPVMSPGEIGAGMCCVWYMYYRCFGFLCCDSYKPKGYRFSRCICCCCVPYFDAYDGPSAS